MDFTEHIGSLASLVGSLTVVGSALLWIYNKFIGAPREKRRLLEETKRQRMMLDLVRSENAPLLETLQELNKTLEESKRDRENLNSISAKNSKKIKELYEEVDDHNERLITLEVINRVSTRESKYANQGVE